MPILRPDASEHAPYFQSYVTKVPGADAIAELEASLDETCALVAAHADKADYAYAEGKWTVKQVLGHLIDAERVFAYRALTFARADVGPLPGFEENHWAAANTCAGRRLEDLVAEMRAVRLATLALFRGFDASELSRSGTASGRPFTVRSLAWIAAGHARHHLGILRDRYFG